jgi:hypothetical protein
MNPLLTDEEFNWRLCKARASGSTTALDNVDTRSLLWRLTSSASAAAPTEHHPDRTHRRGRSPAFRDAGNRSVVDVWPESPVRSNEMLAGLPGPVDQLADRLDYQGGLLELYKMSALLSSDEARLRRE